jgi:hypothetical protein
MAEAAPDTSHLSIDNSSVFVPDEPAGDEAQEAPQEVATEGDGEGEAAPPEAEAEEATHEEPDDLDALMQKFAKEHELDLNNPSQRKLAKRLADREVTYRKQQEEIAKLKTATVDYDAEFKKELDGPPKEAAKPEEVKATPDETRTPAPAERKPLTYRDIGEPFENDDEAFSALNDAWRDGDFKKVERIDGARFNLQFVNKAVPFIQRMMDARLDSFRQRDLAADLQPVRETVQERMESRAKDAAIQQLRKLPAFKDLHEEMFKPEGEDILYHGEAVDNSPINRILIEYGGLQKIHVDDPDPFKAAARTHLLRFTEAAKIYAQQKKSSAITGTKAKELVATGAKMAQRESGNERVRQALNSGPGASGRTPPAKQNYAKDLQDLEGSASLSRLFAKRE